MKPRLFIINAEKLKFPPPVIEDMESISLFGLEGGVSAFNTDAFIHELEQRLAAHNFQPETDFVCLTGAMAGICVLVAILAFKHGVVNMMIYNSRMKEYVSRTIRKGE